MMFCNIVIPILRTAIFVVKVCDSTDIVRFNDSSHNEKRICSLNLVMSNKLLELIWKNTQ